MFNIIKADESIINAVSIEMKGADPVSGWPVGNKIELQFPPRIRGNGKKANWQVEPTKSYEPIAIWMGSEPTTLELELMYVVTGHAGWNVSKISRTVHNVMGYFYRAVQDGSGKGVEPPVVELKLYEVAPSSGVLAWSRLSTWRIESASISQTDELILDSDMVYPQVTTINLSLLMMTKIGHKDKKGGESKPKQLKDSKVLPLQPSKEWY